MLKVGLVGCGAIGTEIARAFQTKFRHTARLAYICDRNQDAVRRFQKKFKHRYSPLSIPELIQKSDLIVEAASQHAVRQVVPLALKSGKRVLVLSVGGLLHLPQVFKSNFKGLLYVPSGAVGGIDALLAARQGKIKRVFITTKKPLKSLKGAPFWQHKAWLNKKITKPVTIFQGTALEAIHLFPQNINVAATLSLAGIGPEKTKVRIMTSPDYKRNIHEITIEGDFGRIQAVSENVPSKQNPKTSFLAILSAISCLEKIFSNIKIGT